MSVSRISYAQEPGTYSTLPAQNIDSIKFDTVGLVIPKPGLIFSSPDSTGLTPTVAVPAILPAGSDVKRSLRTAADTLRFGADSLKKFQLLPLLKKQASSLRVRGSVSIGYEYGVLPYIAADQFPAGGYKTEGRLSFFIASIPLELTYRYTTVKNVTGINNFFRLSYDAARYKDQLNEKLSVNDELTKKKVDSLELGKQKLAMKMLNLDLLEQAYSNPVSTDLTSMPSYDTTLSSPELPVTDKSKPEFNYSGKKDSIHSQRLIYQQKYDSISGAIVKLKETMNSYMTAPEAGAAVNNPYLSKIQSFLGNIRKFEIGLCNPSYSTFLASNIPVQGINFEYASPDHFFAFTYGTTVNSILYDPKTIEGTMAGARNLYNFFDFGNLSTGRKILAIKGGTGQKDGTHLYAGVLLGKGRTDYLSPYEGTSSSKESNVVIEIDGRYKFSPVLSMDLIYGKSSVQSEDLSLGQIKKSFKEIFSSFRSNAVQAKVNYDIIRTGTKLTLSSRFVDPYFKSFGVGFMRSDNFRYEIKIDQPITKKIRYTVSYRKEEDNLLRLYDYKNTLQMLSNTLFLKLSRQFSLRLNYSPLLRKLESGSTTLTDRNHISTGILSFVPRFKKVQANFNILYSKYQITADSGNIHFDNMTYTHQFQLKNGFKTGLNASWFKNSLRDTANNDTYLAVLDIGYTSAKQNAFTIGGKAAYKPGQTTEYGFIARLTLRVYKSLFWEAEGEKILIGDYYNNILEWQIRKFPYYFNTKLTYTF